MPYRKAVKITCLPSTGRMMSRDAWMTRLKWTVGLAAVFGLVALSALVIQGQQGCGDQAGASGCTRVLFIGNSYTYVNDLPAMFAGLARSGGHRVETAMVAEGGATLAEHAASAATSAATTSKKWDVVVLKEETALPEVQQGGSAGRM